MCIFHFTKDKIATNLIPSIGTYQAENVAPQMSKSCRQHRRWAALMDNPAETQLELTIE